MSDLTKLSNELNNELKAILTNPNGNDEVTKYLKNYLRYSFFRRFIKYLILINIFLAIPFTLIYYIPFLNWNASAIGRLALIKYLLPHYDWQYLYRSRCLIEKFNKQQTTYDNDNYNTYNEFNTLDECAVCESLGNLVFSCSTRSGRKEV